MLAPFRELGAAAAAGAVGEAGAGDGALGSAAAVAELPELDLSITGAVTGCCWNWALFGRS